MFHIHHHRSCSNEILVEDRREDSSRGHRIRRTIADLQRQRRLLKTQLQNRVHRWSENLKQPSFIRTRDKISFSFGVANACFSPLIGKMIKTMECQ